MLLIFHKIKTKNVTLPSQPQPKAKESEHREALSVVFWPGYTVTQWPRLWPWHQTDTKPDRLHRRTNGLSVTRQPLLPRLDTGIVWQSMCISCMVMSQVTHCNPINHHLSVHLSTCNVESMLGIDWGNVYWRGCIQIGLFVVREGVLLSFFRTKKLQIPLLGSEKLDPKCAMHTAMTVQDIMYAIDKEEQKMRADEKINLR